jgi:hypothetical protein
MSITTKSHTTLSSKDILCIGYPQTIDQYEVMFTYEYHNKIPHFTILTEDRSAQGDVHIPIRDKITVSESSETNSIKVSHKTSTQTTIPPNDRQRISNIGYPQRIDRYHYVIILILRDKITVSESSTNPQTRNRSLHKRYLIFCHLLICTTLSRENLINVSRHMNRSTTSFHV